MSKQLDKAVIVDLKGKTIIFGPLGVDEDEMADLSKRFKKLGAVEVIFNESGVDIDVLSDEDLESIGLQRIKRGTNGKTGIGSKSSH